MLLAKYVGRAGALAVVALGVGATVAITPGVAFAQPSDSDSPPSSGRSAGAAEPSSGASSSRESAQVDASSPAKSSALDGSAGSAGRGDSGSAASVTETGSPTELEEVPADDATVAANGDVDEPAQDGPATPQPAPASDGDAGTAAPIGVQVNESVVDDGAPIAGPAAAGGDGSGLGGRAGGGPSADDTGGVAGAAELPAGVEPRFRGAAVTAEPQLGTPRVTSNTAAATDAVIAAGAVEVPSADDTGGVAGAAELPAGVEPRFEVATVTAEPQLGTPRVTLNSAAATDAVGAGAVEGPAASAGAVPSLADLPGMVVEAVRQFVSALVGPLVSQDGPFPLLSVVVGALEMVRREIESWLNPPVIDTGSNAAPVNTMPTGGWTTFADTSLALTGLSIADRDAHAHDMSVTLFVDPDTGRLTADSTATVAVAHSGTNEIVLTGQLDELNAFLAGPGVRYTSVANADGDRALRMTTSDNGGTGAGGPQRATTLAYIKVKSVVPNTVIGTVQVGAGPADVAVSPAGDRIYVTHRDLGTISVIDSATLTVIDTVKVGGYPYSVAVNDDGSRVYASDRGTGSIVVVDTTTNASIDRIPMYYPMDITVSGNRLYVTDEGSNFSAVDTDTNRIVMTTGVDTQPQSVAISQDGTRAYVASRSEYTVSVIDTATFDTVAVIPVDRDPVDVAVSPDGSRVYTSNNVRDTVSVIDTSTNTVVDTVPAGHSPFGLAVSPDGTRVYVANWDKDLLVIDTATNSVIGTVKVGKGNKRVAVSPDGNRVYVTNPDDGTVSVVATGFNEPPTNTMPADGWSTREKTPLALTGLSIAYGDANASMSVTLRVDPNAGKLTANQSDNVEVNASTSDEIVLTGHVDALNAFLAGPGVTYTSLPTVHDANWALSMTTKVNGVTGVGDSQQVTDAAHIKVIAVNDPPVNTMPARWSINEKTPLALTGLSIADEDVDKGNMSVTLFVSPSAGRLTADSTATVAVTNSGTNEIVLAGQLDALNAFLAGPGVTYTSLPTVRDASWELWMTTSDKGNTGIGGTQRDKDSRFIKVIAVNDPPVNTMPAGWSTLANTPLALTGLSIADEDADKGNMSVTLFVNPDTGRLTADSTATVAVTNSGTNEIVLAGQLNALNAFLAGPGVTYTSLVNADGGRAVWMTTSDKGNTGIGGTQRDKDSKYITVKKVPTFSPDIRL